MKNSNFQSVVNLPMLVGVKIDSELLMYVRYVLAVCTKQIITFVTFSEPHSAEINF